MMTMQDFAEVLDACGGDTLENYIVPGLRSTLIANSDAGKIRRFQMTREHETQIVPHNHRYAFGCLVLRGHVVNHLYLVGEGATAADATHALAAYNPKDHSVDVDEATLVRCVRGSTLYRAGDFYTMGPSEFHSIEFSPDADVLFLEGRTSVSHSCCLLLAVDGRICNTFLWRDWMMAKA